MVKCFWALVLVFLQYSRWLWVPFGVLLEDLTGLAQPCLRTGRTFCIKWDLFRLVLLTWGFSLQLRLLPRSVPCYKRVMVENLPVRITAVKGFWVLCTSLEVLSSFFVFPTKTFISSLSFPLILSLHLPVDILFPLIFQLGEGGQAEFLNYDKVLICHSGEF